MPSLLTNSRSYKVNVVANVHSFNKIDDNLYNAHPYAISLVAGPKRNKPDECTIELLDSLDLEEIIQRKHVYTDFSPFKPVNVGLYGDADFLFANGGKRYTDTIGFVLETYFLATDIEVSDAFLHGPRDLYPVVYEKYNKYRAKRYFKPFSDVKPRRIWGCDSPIELFLLQGLSIKNLYPIIQTIIFNDGSIFDNYYDMVKEGVFIKGDEIITEADFYFPDSKLAVFCDSTQFHRGSKSKDKDSSVDNQLRNLGIRSLRLSGKQIVESLNDAVQLVINSL